MNNKISNPYSKKKNQQTSINHSSARDAAGLHVVDLGDVAAASFSQAFRSVEDTVHFKNDDSRAGVLEDDVRAQQRIFESKVNSEQGLLEARNQHVLLQQPHVLYVSTKQRGNGLLQFIRNVPFQFSTMIPDYILSSQRCALFLSIKYHTLFPDYIHRRIAELKSDFTLRILLVLIDVEDNANTLLHLNKTAVIHSFTLILAWTEEEAARYLETYKALDGKDASTIQKKEQTNFVDQMADVLGMIRSVNKTDSVQLLSQFGTLKAIMTASMDELVLCPGVGEKKVKRIYDAFHKPFSSKRAKQRKENDTKKGNSNEVSQTAALAVIAPLGCTKEPDETETGN
jgi:DNA excision repair protein ERCC-1